MDIVRITELQPKTYVEQGDYIAIDNQSDGTKKVQFTNLLDDTLSQENKIAPANIVGNEIATIRAAVGSPLKASTVAQMTDTNKIYVYVGSESGYTNGNWYYWDGSAWTSGGVYNSVAVVTDPTLTLSGVPADAKATGDEVTDLKSALNDISEPTANLFDVSKVIGGYIKDDGTLSIISSASPSSYVNPDYISVIGGETYSFTSGRYLTIATYNANKTFIARTYYGTGNSVALDSNVAFVRLTANGGDFFTNNFMFVKGSELPVEFIPYGRKLKGDFVTVDEVRSEQYMPTETIVDEILPFDNTKIFTPHETSLSSGKKVKFKIDTSADSFTVVIAFLKQGSSTYYQQQFLYSIHETDLITLEDNYAQIAVYNADITVNVKIDLLEEINNELTKAIKELQDRPNNLTFSVIGDSWSAYKGYSNPPTNSAWYPSWETHVEGSNNNVDLPSSMWWHLFGVSNNMKMVENNSYSGSPISFDGYGTGTDDAKSYSFVTRAMNMISADVFFVEGGTNDSNVGVALGDYKYSHWTDSDLIYFRPAVCKLLDYLKNRHPMAKIYFLINGNMLSDYKDSIITACEHYDVDYIVMSTVALQNNHPSITGQANVAEYAEQVVSA